MADIVAKEATLDATVEHALTAGCAVEAQVAKTAVAAPTLSVTNLTGYVTLAGMAIIAGQLVAALSAGFPHGLSGWARLISQVAAGSLLVAARTIETVLKIG